MSPRPESIKKVMDVLGDFNPSEDKVKKTLGIDEEEMRLINEEKHVITSPAKDRIPINRKLTRKAQDTLGINLSKEKLMDVLGVDENTINCAEEEESEHKEIQIKKVIENTITTNKRSLQKALSNLGIDPSYNKISKTLGVPEDQITKTSQQSSLSIIHILFFISIAVLFISMAVIYNGNNSFLNFKSIINQLPHQQQATPPQPQFNSNHNNNHHHHHFNN